MTWKPDHVYEGDCPFDHDTEAFDPECARCQIDKLEAEVERLKGVCDSSQATEGLLRDVVDGLRARVRYYQDVLCLSDGPMLALEAGVQTPAVAPVEVGDLVAQRDRLERWKSEALEVLGRWDRVASVLGLDEPEPYELGRSKSESALKRVEALEAERDESRSAYLRLCRDLAMHTKGWGAVPGGSPREAAEVEVRIKAAQALGASDEAVGQEQTS